MKFSISKLIVFYFFLFALHSYVQSIYYAYCRRNVLFQFFMKDALFCSSMADFLHFCERVFFVHMKTATSTATQYLRTTYP